jgi:Kef-type K+ transport system membrane component KefB
MQSLLILAQTTTPANNDSSGSTLLIVVGVIFLIVYIFGLVRTIGKWQNKEKLDAIDMVIVVIAIPIFLFLVWTSAGNFPPGNPKQKQ